MAAATKTLSDLKDRAKARWDKLTDDDFDSIRDDVAELATRIQARYGISAEEAKRQADEFVSAASEAASDAYDRAVAALDNAARQVDQVVKANAWATVGSAILLGGVVGYLIGSDQRRSRW